MGQSLGWRWSEGVSGSNFFPWSIIVLPYCVSFCCTTKQSSCLHPITPLWCLLPALPSSSKPSRAPGWPLCYKQLPPAVYFTHGSVCIYMSMLFILSPLVPQFLPQLWPQVCSPSLQHCSCPASRFTSTAFLDSVYVH